MQKDEFLLLYNYLLLKDVHVIISIDFGWIVRDLIHFGACGYLFFIDAAAWAFKVDTKAVFWTAVTVTLLQLGSLNPRFWIETAIICSTTFCQLESKDFSDNAAEKTREGNFEDGAD